MRLTRGLFLAVLLAASPTAALADDVTIGTAGTNFGWPFSNYYYEGSIAGPRYQQVYASSRFSDAVFIDAIRFHNTRGGDINPGNYTLRLSTTSKPVRGLSTTLDSNLGGDAQTFFSGALSASSLRISGMPFLYDPAAGNLLLEVLVHSVSVRNYTQTGLDGTDYRDINSGTSAAYTVWGYNHAAPMGLVTTFETTPADTVTPEPVSMALLGTGLAGVAAVRRRRRKREED